MHWGGEIPFYVNLAGIINAGWNSRKWNFIRSESRDVASWPASSVTSYYRQEAISFFYLKFVSVECGRSGDDAAVTYGWSDEWIRLVVPAQAKFVASSSGPRGQLRSFKS